ncbi:MAG TPA: TAT-variant-translocated molybdopterin oxidoreductase, partial [Chthoniobacteraceae bacterium]
MKRVFQHPTEPATGRKYWRSLGQLNDTPEFRGWLEREFPQGAAELQGGDVTRRNFLKLMGASTALAGLSLSACRRPEKHLVPFTRGVEWAIPGKALFFATSMPSRRGAQPLVITTYDGRPTKIEGNPLHPVSGGATDTWAQSSILDLYDPDRSRFFWHMPRGGQPGKVKEADFTKWLDEALAGAGDGAGLAFLLEADQSPTRERLRLEIEKKFPKAIWSVYEPLAATDSTAIYGEGVVPTPNIAEADVIMALDCDFLGVDGFLPETRQFSARRRVEGPDARMNRLYVVENRYTITGAMADHRMRLPASQIGSFLSALAKEVGGAGAGAEATGLQPLTAPVAPEWIREAAADLVAAKGKALVLVGPRQPAAVQALAANINSTLGGLGATLQGRRGVRAGVPIQKLVEAITGKTVKTLFVIGGNPVYNAPADLNWAQLQGGVENVVRVGFHEDETTKLATWHVPATHYLESWGDGRAADGSYTAVQPMIMPLFGGWSELDLLAKLAGRPKPQGPELVQETFRELLKPADFPAAWTKFLHDGFQAESATKPEPLAISGGAAAAGTPAAPAPAAGADTFEVVLAPDTRVDDGRYANNGWLQ